MVCRNLGSLKSELLLLCCALSCPTLGDPMDCSPPGSSVHRILQARILESVAISYSRGPSQPRDQTCGEGGNLRINSRQLYAELPKEYGNI